MQTFLPYPDFQESARMLDYKRLGKQRVETMQIYNAMNDPTAAWHNHPMSAMWRDTPDSLLVYGAVMCHEWIRRGYNDNMLSWFQTTLNEAPAIQTTTDPVWLGDDRLHSSHRAALLHKHLSFYQRFGWTETPKLDYYWPV